MKRIYMASLFALIIITGIAITTYVRIRPTDLSELEIEMPDPMIDTCEAMYDVYNEDQALFQEQDEAGPKIIYEPVLDDNPDEVIDLEEIWATITDFSQALFHKVVTGEEENIILSPLAVYYALAILALGVGGDIAYEISAVLGYEPWVAAREIRQRAEFLADTSRNTALCMLASAWINDAHTITPEFYQAIRPYFNSELFTRDFADATTFNEMNNWFYNRTEGLFKGSIDKICPEDIIILLNALHISIEWHRFTMNYRTEWRRFFYPESGQAYEIEFLNSELVNFPASRTNYYEAILLPFINGGLWLFLVRPVDGTAVGDFVVEKDIFAILSSLEASPGGAIVSIPNLEKESSIDISNSLATMGFTALFGHYIPDFTGITTDGADIYISAVRQSSRFTLNRYGVNVPFAERGPFLLREPWEDTLILEFNTPFVYAIVDMETGIPFLMGVVDNP